MKLGVASALLCAINAAPSPQQVLSAMQTANSYFISSVANGLGDCGWERGTYWAGNAAHYAVSGNETLRTLATQWATSWGYACKNSTNANDQICGEAYRRLYQQSPSADKLGLDYILGEMVANASMVADWTWLDAVFMALPTFLEYGAILGNNAYWTKAMNEYTYTAYYIPSAHPAITKKGLWDPAYGLFYRDPTYFNATSPNGEPVFWGRGNSWAISAMARAVEALPAGHPYASEFGGKLVSMAHSLAPLQGSDGMWRSNLLDSSAFSNPETTGTAGFTFGIAWGINNGWLDPTVFTPVVLNAWQGLTTVALQPSGLVGWCQPPNGQPAAATQTDTSDFCVGLWLMAGSEVYKLVSATA